MPKENVYPPDHERVKDQQQCSRISQNFRATKSFLVRKRPRETFHSHQKDGTAIGSPGSAASIKRVPLKDISVNSPSLHSFNRLELINAKCSGGPWESAVQRDGERLSNSFITPVKPVEVSTSNESVSIPFLLDDDFDESFLQEIDAICEQSAAKAEREAQSRIFHEKSGYNYNRSSSESVTTNAHSSMADSLDHGDYVRAGVDMQEINAIWEKSAAEGEREAHSMIFHEESRHSDNRGSSESVTTNGHTSMADSSDHGDYMRAGADTQEIDAIWEKSAAKVEREAQRRIFHEESQYNRSSSGSVATSEHASMEDSLDYGDYISAGVDMQEIDAICEKSAAKSEGEAQSSIFNEENRLNDNRGSSESITTSKHTSMADSLDHDDYRKAGVYMQELDAICEKSAAKAKREAQSRIFHEETRHNDNRSSSETVTTNEHTNMADSLHPGDYMNAGVDEKDTSRTVQNESMPAEYTKYLQSLNDRQREAACSDISTPLLIAAGPGSGKTSTMVGRILYMLNEGLSSSNILAMTFTTAAASEMRDRIGAVAGKATAKELTISTFHSFSLQLCRAHAEKLGRTLEFLIYGHGQQRRAIIEAVRLLENTKSRQNPDANKLCQDSDGLSCPQYLKDKSRKWQKFVTQAKASGKTPADCIKMGDEIGAAILGNYNDILRSCNALDYHDLISCSVKLLTDFPEVLKECQELWKAIIIDEFQDTSAMQYSLLRTLASHKCITVVGDDDQSIFSFNGADISGFDSFRKDFANHKEVRLTRNYRSTRCIVEAASSLIQHNTKRCHLKNALTENSYGSKITIKECHNEDAQCAFVVDKILEMASDGSASKGSWGNIAVLYRRQVSGKVFQKVFRERRIPFNIHGVAFYRKKVVRAIIGMLKTTLPGSDDGPYRQAFKALLPLEKEEKKRVISHIEKISTVRNCSFLSAARDIFSAKISGTFKRSQLTQGRKVLSTLEMISKLAWREQSISAVITSVANMLPQKYLLEQRAVVDSDGGKLLNEDNDLRSVLQYLLDDVSDFLSTRYTAIMEESKEDSNRDGCLNLLTAFIDYISEREIENFRTRKYDNQNSVTLTTIHQAKGLEWDTVFIVKANETEIPLLHECQGASNEKGTSVEEERRLLYVAMTRAREKLFILHVTVDSDWKLLQPSRFLKEVPHHLLEIQAEIGMKNQQRKHGIFPQEAAQPSIDMPTEGQPSKRELVLTDSFNVQCKGASEELTDPVHGYEGNTFLKRFEVDNRSVVSHLFHQWAKRKAFQEPKRLLDKVRFVIDERLRVKTNKHKDLLRTLRSCLSSEEALHYAEYVLRWEQVPADKRAHLMREKQEHFQKLRIEKSMGSSAPTPKQIAFLQGLGCTVVPTSRLHASRLIEQYRAL